MRYVIAGIGIAAAAFLAFAAYACVYVGAQSERSSRYMPPHKQPTPSDELKETDDE